METNIFKVGDKVRGNSDEYNITNYNMTLGEVIKVIDNDEIIVKILKHKDAWRIGCTYTVESKYFVSAEFTKDDLQDGDIVTLRNGDKLVYTRHGFKDILDDYNNGIAHKGDLNKDLTRSNGDDDQDIVKVERPTTYTTVYKREEVKEMTIAEISKALGYEVKIVKEDK